MLTYLFNAILRLHYWPHSHKVAEIILILKPGKDPKDVTSYRPISLLPTPAKLLEKLILRRTDPDHTAKDWIPHHQFGFRRAHSTSRQCHRITHTILTALHNSEYCTAAFLDVSQAFDKVWHPGLLYKIQQHLPTFFPILKSYLSDRQSRTRVKDKVSALFPIKSGVPQESVLGPLLYILFTADLPQVPNVTVGTFADDTAILTSHTSLLHPARVPPYPQQMATKVEN